MNSIVNMVLDVAFRDNMEKKKKLNFNDTINATLGVYSNGMLAVSLNPTHGWKDWVINFLFLPLRMSPFFLCSDKRAKTHKGYTLEWIKYRNDFISQILFDKDYFEASQKGIIVSGRSKGGGEAAIIAPDLALCFGTPKDKVYVGMIEAPRMCNKAYKEWFSNKFSEMNCIRTVYKNDIVPGIPFFYTIPGQKYTFGKRTLGLSFKDHSKACTHKEVFDA